MPPVAKELAKAFRVSDYGAVGDGETDDGPAVREAVEAAVQAGVGSSVVFEKKKYRMGRFDGQVQIELSGVSGITIEGNGAEIINNPYNGFISITDSSNVTMRGFFFDCDPLGFTQGDIVKTSPATGEIWVKIHDGFIDPLEISNQLKKKVWNRVGFTIDADERKLKPGPIDFVESIEADGDRLRVKLKDPGFTHIVKGDRFIFGLHQGGHGATINVERSADVLLEEYTIYSAKFGMHHTFSDNHGRVHVRRGNITFRPGTDRLITSIKDGFHVKHNAVGPIIEECLLEGMMDDAINISVCPYWVKEDLGNNRYLIAEVAFSPRVGDRLMAYTPNPGIVSGELKVLSVEPQKKGKGKWNIITLDQPIPWVALHTLGNLFPGGHDRLKFTGLYNLDACGKDYIVRNNRFLPQRRHALLARGVGGLFEGNLVDGVGGSGVNLGNEIGSFYEGPFPGDTIIRNNTFKDVEWYPIRVYARGESAKAEGITIENNRFHGWADSAVHLSNVDGGSITRNVIGPGRNDPAKSKAVRVQESANVRIENNLVTDQRPGLAADYDLNDGIEVVETGLPGFDDKLTDSLNGFSDTQGSNGWNYGFVRTTSRSVRNDMPGNGGPMKTFDSGRWKNGSVAISASSFVAAPGLAVLRRWTTESAGGVRIVGSLQKPDGETSGEFRVLVDGKKIWSRTLEKKDTIRHGFDIPIPGLSPEMPVDFIVMAGARPVEVQAAFEIIPEPFLSRWSPNASSGYPKWPEAERQVLLEKGQAVMESIRQAQGRIVIPPGDYLFNGDWSKESTLKDLADLEIIAEGVTFWFEPPMIHGLLFENCRDVTVRGLSIDYTLPIFSQARITAIDRDNKSIRAELMKGYEPLDQNGKPETSGERKLIFYNEAGGFIPHRHTRSDWTLSKDGKTIEYAKARVNPIPAVLKVGDYVVSPIQTGAALRSIECARMRYEDVNIWSSPGMAVYEGFGEGGNVYRRVRATRRPHTNRLQAFGADIFHLEGTDRGPTLERCEAAYGADDTLNIHGKLGRVVEQVDDRHYYLQGEYERGDMLEFRDSSTVDLLGIAQVVSVKETPDGPELPINDKYSAKGEVLIELDQPLRLEPLSFVVLDGKQSADGFVVRDCWFHDDFQRTLINGSPNGLIENTTLQHVGHGIDIQFETWGPWMEGPFARNMVVRNNRFLNASPMGKAVTVSMHPAGGGTNSRRLAAKPVTNMLISGNLIDRASGMPLEIHNVDGLFILGNQIDRPGYSGTSEWVRLQDCENVSMRD
jgi:hypothetical protein